LSKTIQEDSKPKKMSAKKLDELVPETSAYKILCHLAFRGSVLKPQEIAEELGENGST